VYHPQKWNYDNQYYEDGSIFHTAEIKDKQSKQFVFLNGDKYLQFEIPAIILFGRLFKI